ncbi:MAG TPA: TonB-dependent receptor [Myxococcales bacterium]|jgi:outer membrane receptor protein involved in Fe transport
MNALRRLALLTAISAAVLASTAGPARADNTADEADLRFRRGVEAYKAGKYEDALSEFFFSNRLVRNLNVTHNIARCYEQLKMYDEAYRYYREVLNETSKADDKRPLNDSLARIAPRVALLQVTSNPAGSDLFIERKDLGSLGVTPKVLALPAGKTTVVLSRPGYRDASKVVDLAVGRTASVELNLEFVWGHVKLTGSPEGAQVRVDQTEGPPAGKLPGKLDVKPGKHILNISEQGFLAMQVPIEVGGDQTVEASAELQPIPPPTGNVMVTANHEGALVRVDGQESGFTPTVISLAEGPHRVEVTLADMTAFAQKVEVKANATVQVRASLSFGGGKTTAASKSETSVEDAPASITVISRDELRAFGYQTVLEALRGVRGLYGSNDRQYEMLGIRGFSPPGDVNNRVMVLFDGHSVADAVGGAAYVGRDLDADLAAIERIEVVRGPVSSLYGTGAVFGVVNVVPRKHLDDHYVEATAGAGSLGAVGGRVMGAYRYEGGEAMVTVAGGRVGGDEQFPMPTDPVTLVRDQDREVAFHGTARVRYKGFSLLADVNSREKLLPTGASETILGQYGTKVRDQRAIVEARYEHAFENDGQLAARLYYDANRYAGWWQYDAGEQTDHTEGDTGGVELRYRTFEILRSRLTVGLEFQEQFRLHMGTETEGVAAPDKDGSVTIASAYLALESKPVEQFAFNLSARADWYSSFGLAVNPRLAIIAKPWTGGAIKLMGGTSFRAPSNYERFYDDGYYDEAGHYVFFSIKPNDKLQPEHIYTGELELSQRIGSDLKATAALYVNFLENVVRYVMDPADGLLQARNAPGLVRTQGAELELRWQPSRLAMVTATYTFQQMFVTGVSDPADQAALRSNVPPHMFSLRGMFPISAPFVVGSAEAVYNAARLDRAGLRTGELLYLNAGLSGELPSARFRYWAGVKNLLDERPQLPASPDVSTATLPAYGRTFQVQLTASY